MSSHTIGFGDPRKDVQSTGSKAIEKYFSPEFRNRLDAIITFNSLTVEITEKIVDKFIDELNLQLSPKKVSVTLSKPARRWLAENGYDARMGARPLRRLIQTEIKDRLSDEILFGHLEKGGAVSVGVKNDALTFRFNDALKTKRAAG
jgi:ATP-dependent Clp protease ATP-binding subunit ClpA